MARMNNPAIKNLSKYQDFSLENASYGGIAIKTIMLVFIAFVFALLSAALILNGVEFVIPLLIVSFIGAMVCGFVCSFMPKSAPITAPLYAAFEGLLIGFISLMFEAEFSGIVFTALVATLIVLAVMMALYYSGVVRVGSKFRRVMMIALISVVIANLLFFIISLFSASFYQMVYGQGLLAILVSTIMVIVASAMLLIDLDNITATVENGLPKKYEWLAAFGLTVTLIWLYLEMLRLLAILARTLRR